jgi:hypothetical protein
MQETYEENECFICFEVSTQYEKYPLRLKNQLEFFKVCACDGWIHTSCIEIWCNMNETCPICRNKMMYINFELQYGIYLVHYFFLTKKYIFIFINQLVKIRNVFIFCVIITNIINILDNAIHNFEKKNNDYNDPQIL